MCTPDRVVGRIDDTVTVAVGGCIGRTKRLLPDVVILNIDDSVLVVVAGRERAAGSLKGAKFRKRQVLAEGCFDADEFTADAVRVDEVIVAGIRRVEWIVVDDVGAGDSRAVRLEDGHFELRCRAEVALRDVVVAAREEL